MPNLRILFTGATSFTGMWFARKLAEDGHEVVVAIHRPRQDYSGLRAERLEQLTDRCAFVWNTPFGTPEFLDLIGGEKPFDLLCHHAAEVKDYKSPNFDVAAAVAANIRGLPAVLDSLRDTGCRRIVLTGTVFEADEGAGSMPLRAFSPYGVSKTLTAQVFREQAERQDFALGKFVIPNPFGAYEESRFTEYLMRCWKDGMVAKINTPAYVRDNIPVTLLASAYGRFAASLPQSGFFRFNPSFYVETQGAFAQRFADEIGRRLKITTPLEFAHQTAFPEPEVRINTDPLRDTGLDWSEADFWHKTAQYYARRLDIPAK
jgi:UDP-glucose 4-epimerase